MAIAKIGDRTIGDGQPTLVSFEPGATHQGYESARRLCRAVADAGADAVKFQTVLADDLLAASEDATVEYQTVDGKSSESVYRALKRRELTFAEWRDLKAYCDELGLLFISTPSGKETVDLLVEIGADAIKVSKSDISHRLLVDYIARQGLPVVLDGRERFEDVETAARICEAHGINDIVLMHCPSGYPVNLAGVHLRAIPHIRAMYDRPVGYSDHSVGSTMNFAAIALGADYVEKTITEDRGTNAVEHFMSLDLCELKPFVEQIRALDESLGDPRVIFSSRVNPAMRRGIFASRDLDMGQSIGLEGLEFRRPEAGIPAGDYERILGKRVLQGISAGSAVRWQDLE